MSATFELIKILSKRFGLPIQVCKDALDNSENEIDSAVLWLRNNKQIPNVSTTDLYEKCRTYAQELAIDFLETTRETGELQRYYDDGNLEIIQENFFFMFISELDTIIPAEVTLLTNDELEDLEDKIHEYYSNVVDEKVSGFVG